MEYGIWGLHAAGGLWGDPRFSRRQPIIPPDAMPQNYSRASLALSFLHHQHESGELVDTDVGAYEAMALTAKSSSTTDEARSEASTPLDKSKKSEDIETNIERNEDDGDDNQSPLSNGIHDNETLGNESDTASTNSSHNPGNNSLLNKFDPISCYGFDKDETVNPMLNGWVLGAYTAMLGRLSAATAVLEATEVPSLPSESDSEMSDHSSCNEKSRDTSPVAGAYRGYPCGSCEIVATTRPALKKHILNCHPASSSSGSETGGTGNPRRCPSIGCDFTSTSRCEIETHVAAHVAQGMAPTGKKRTLALQRVRYEREEYRCSLCTYACTIEKAFQRHLKAHAGGTAPETRVSCAVCGADRSSEVDLSRHMRRHRDDRYFCCDICVFRTVQLKKLIQHRRMHTGEKPHLCPHCAYRSARRDNLRSHVRRVHKKENLYCDTFSPRGMLITPTEIDVDSVSNLIRTPATSPPSDTNVAH